MKPSRENSLCQGTVLATNTLLIQFGLWGAKVWVWLAINVQNLGSMWWCGHCGAFKMRGFTGDCEVMGHCPPEWIQVLQDHTLLRQSYAP